MSLLLSNLSLSLSLSFSALPLFLVHTSPHPFLSLASRLFLGLYLPYRSQKEEENLHKKEYRDEIRKLHNHLSTQRTRCDNNLIEWKKESIERKKLEMRDFLWFSVVINARAVQKVSWVRRSASTDDAGVEYSKCASIDAGIQASEATPSDATRPYQLYSSSK